MSSNTVVKTLLLVTFLLASCIAIYSLTTMEAESNNAQWAGLAGALSVIAAVISAWNSQKAIELSEDAVQPNLSFLFDFYSRYDLAQLRMINNGNSDAYNIFISWDREIITDKRETAVFPHTLGEPDIPILCAKENISISLGSAHRFMQSNENLLWSGTLRYENGRGKKYKKPFTLSAESRCASLLHDEELPKTLYELQKLPKELSDIGEQLEKIHSELSKK